MYLLCAFPMLPAPHISESGGTENYHLCFDVGPSFLWLGNRQRFFRQHLETYFHHSTPLLPGSYPELSRNPLSPGGDLGESYQSSLRLTTYLLRSLASQGFSMIQA